MRVIDIRKMTIDDREVYSVTMDKGMLYELRSMLNDATVRSNFESHVAGFSLKGMARINNLSRACLIVNKFLTETFGEDKPTRFPTVGGTVNAAEGNTVDTDQ